jgi:hypothetical protein
MKKLTGALTRINKHDVTEITASGRDTAVITLEHDGQEEAIRACTGMILRARMRVSRMLVVVAFRKRASRPID